MTDERLGGMTVDGFLEVLGSDAPTPGGGAAGAIAGATGAALIAMVGRLTVGKKGFEEVDETDAPDWSSGPMRRERRSSIWRIATPTRSTV